MFSTEMLQRLQASLTRLYDIHVPYDVRDFTIDTQGLADIDRSHQPVADESLLVMQEADEAHIALFLHEKITSELTNDDPYERLHDGNLNQFLIAVEGVSHFMYLSWNAQYDRPVSRFELELQAEVDKYLLCLVLLMKQGTEVSPRFLITLLFARPVYNQAYGHDVQQRYERANQLASVYCSQLYHSCLKDYRRPMMSEIRRFYRLTQHHKLKHIDKSMG